MSTTRDRTQGTIRRTKESEQLRRLEKKDVKFQIFEDALPYADGDDFWTNKLIRASRGNFPLCFYMRNEFLYFKKSDKETLKMEITGDPKSAFETFKEFLKTCSQIESDKDIEKKKEAILHGDEKYKEDSCTDEASIYEYLFRCRRDWNMTEAEYNNYELAVFSLISMTKKKHIAIKNGKISEVKKIIYEDGCFKIEPKVLSDVISITANARVARPKPKSVFIKELSHPMYLANSKAFESWSASNEYIGKKKMKNPADVMIP